jgi:cellulose synthase/poly-beta-1,6-N-acetylglucosamine synthase-like glycosyltransferase
MIFPWETIRTAPLSSGNLVEDLQLGLDLAMGGAAPLFLSSAVTTSQFPASEKGADIQRQRWVQGHLTTTFRQLPWLLVCALRRADANLLALAFDLAVPPIVLFAILISSAWILAFAGVLLGLPIAALIPATGNILLLVAGLGLAWLRFGSGRLTPYALIRVIAEFWAKSVIYLEFMRGRSAPQWIRTDRSGGETQTAQLAPKTSHADVVEPG